jgi:hypothetical protein
MQKIKIEIESQNNMVEKMGYVKIFRQKREICDESKEKFWLSPKS